MVLRDLPVLPIPVVHLVLAVLEFLLVPGDLHRLPDPSVQLVLMVLKVRRVLQDQDHLRYRSALAALAIH